MKNNPFLEKLCCCICDEESGLYEVADKELPDVFLFFESIGITSDTMEVPENMEKIKTHLSEMMKTEVELIITDKVK